MGSMTVTSTCVRARLDGKVDAQIDPVDIGRNIKDLYDIDGVPSARK